jgi:prephenate dehydrogenase
MQAIRKLVLLGTGLIGGSFALALKRANLVEEVVGVGRSLENLLQAKSLGVIDTVCQDAAQAVEGADFVFLGTPVGQMGRLMQQIAPHLAADCLISDGGSTKQDVCALYREFLPNQLSMCVPGHPIAGSDRSGSAAASGSLYEGRRVVLTPLPETAAAAVERTRALWLACGAKVFEMPAAEHDGIFAAVSHLPHLLAFAYVNTVLDQPNPEVCLDFAATGFRDFTRIAGSHPEMWRDIARANKAAILEDLRQYQAELNQLAAQLEADDFEGLTTRFERASEARVEWGRQYH